MTHKDIWKDFDTKLSELLESGYRLPQSCHAVAIDKVDKELQSWRSLAQHDVGAEVLSSSHEKLFTEVGKSSKKKGRSHKQLDNEVEYISVQPSEDQHRRSTRKKKKSIKFLESDLFKGVSPEDHLVESLISLEETGDEEFIDALTSGTTDSIEQDKSKDTIEEVTIDSVTALKSIKIEIISQGKEDAEDSIIEPSEEAEESKSSFPQKHAVVIKQEKDKAELTAEDAGNGGSKTRNRKKKRKAKKMLDEEEMVEVKEPVIKRPRGRPRKEHESFKVEGESEDEGEKFPCSSCGKQFKSLVYLKQHMKRHDMGPIKCDFPGCNRSYMSHSGYSVHAKVHTDECHRCPHCSYVSGCKTWLDNHLQTHVEDKGSVKTNLCDFCGAGFFRFNQLKRHVEAIHIREKKFACPHCDHKTHSNDLLQNHIGNIHANKDPYVCNVCGATCKYRSSLIDHQRRHYGEKNYKCTKCPFRAVNLTVLAKHRRVHMPREFTCDICGKHFKMKEHLRRHKVIHTGEKNFTCTACPYKCNVSSNLRKHMANVHQLRPERQIKPVQRIEEIQLQENTENQVVKVEKSRETIMTPETVLPNNDVASNEEAVQSLYGEQFINTHLDPDVDHHEVVVIQPMGENIAIAISSEDAENHPHLHPLQNVSYQTITESEVLDEDTLLHVTNVANEMAGGGENVVFQVGSDNYMFIPQAHHETTLPAS